MKNLPTDLLRTFLTLVQLESYTLAGEQLGRSQPAISLQMKRLEEITGKKLLVRQGAKATLTPAGNMLHAAAQKMLAINDEVLTSLKGTQVQGHIRLGLPSEFASILLPKILSRFIQSYPEVFLEVDCNLSKYLLTAENKQKYDVILALQDQVSSDDQAFITSEPLTWVTSPRHSSHSKLPIPLIVAPEGCIYRNRLTKALSNMGKPWKIVYTIPDLTGIKTAINEGLGISALAQSTVPDELKILHHTQNELPELGNIGVSLYVISNRQPAAAQALAHYLKSAFSSSVK